MDPNENLKQQRACIATMNEMDGQMGIENMREFETAAWKLAELSSALDEWLCNGGFKPDDWTHRAKRANRTPTGTTLDLRLKDELMHRDSEEREPDTTPDPSDEDEDEFNEVD
jgi:hypothetical protein